MRCTVRTTGQRSRHGRRRRGPRRWPPRWLPGAAPATRSTSPGRSTQQRRRAAQGHRPVVPLPRPGYGRRWRPVRAAGTESFPAKGSPGPMRRGSAGVRSTVRCRGCAGGHAGDTRPGRRHLWDPRCSRIARRVSRSGSVSPVKVVSEATRSACMRALLGDSDWCCALIAVGCARRIRSA